MKKYSICIWLLLLTACSISQKPLQIDLEPNASITISLPDDKYAQALQKLWEEQYPQAANALQFRVEPYEFHQQFQADIEWVKDSDAVYKKPYSQQVSINQAYEAPASLQREELNDYYIPMIGQGYLFAYKEETLKKKGITTQDLTKFESLIAKEGFYYFYNHYQENLLPLWIADYQQGDQSIKAVWNDETFMKSITDFKQLYKEMHLIDDIYDDASFFDSQYAYGLVNPSEAIASTLYKDGTLHFTKMPSYHGRTLAPFVDVYGFMSSKKSAYPQCVQAFLTLVRSQEGLQALIDAGIDIPLLDESDFSDFHIYDARKKEMIAAVERSQLWDLSVIKEKPSIRFKELYQASGSEIVIQNGVCSGKNAKQMQKEIRSYMRTWVWKQ